MNAQSIPPDPRNALMAALSAVEQTVAALPVAPPVVTLNRVEFTYIVDLYFRFGSEGVALFAEAFGVEVTERDTMQGAPYVEAHTVVCGHEVRAWWLGEVPAPVVLPAAWSAAAVSA